MERCGRVEQGVRKVGQRWQSQGEVACGQVEEACGASSLTPAPTQRKGKPASFPRSPPAFLQWPVAWPGAGSPGVGGKRLAFPTLEETRDQGSVCQ